MSQTMQSTGLLFQRVIQKITETPAENGVSMKYDDMFMIQSHWNIKSLSLSLYIVANIHKRDLTYKNNIKEMSKRNIDDDDC